MARSAGLFAGKKNAEFGSPLKKIWKAALEAAEALGVSKKWAKAVADEARSLSKGNRVQTFNVKTSLLLPITTATCKKKKYLCDKQSLCTKKNLSELLVRLSKVLGVD